MSRQHHEQRTVVHTHRHGHRMGLWAERIEWHEHRHQHTGRSVRLGTVERVVHREHTHTSDDLLSLRPEPKP